MCSIQFLFCFLIPSSLLQRKEPPWYQRVLRSLSPHPSRTDTYQGISGAWCLNRAIGRRGQRCIICPPPPGGSTSGLVVPASLRLSHIRQVDRGPNLIGQAQQQRALIS